MIRLYAEAYYRLGQILAQLEVLSERRVGGGIVSQQTKLYVMKTLGEARTHFVAAGLEITIKGLDESIRILAQRQSPTEQHLNEQVKYLRRVLQDELSSAVVFQVPKENAHYLQARLFGDEVETTFPEASKDIYEAGQCLAFGRNTATVYHLMRIVEVGLKRIGHELGVADFWNNWAKIIEEINRELIQKKVAARSPEWKKREYLISAMPYFSAINEAWRNRVMHADKFYHDPQEVRDIFNAVDGFMRALAPHFKS